MALRDTGIELTPIDLGLKPAPRRLPPCDLVHVELAGGWRAGTLAARVPDGVPLFVTVHPNAEEPDADVRRRAAVVFSLSHTGREALRGRWEGALKVLPRALSQAPDPGDAVLYHDVEAVIAAMQWRRPVVVESRGELAELVRHYGNGLVVEPGASGALTTARQLLRDHAQLREGIELGGLHTAKLTTPRRSARVALDAYREVLAGRLKPQGHDPVISVLARHRTRAVRWTETAGNPPLPVPYVVSKHVAGIDLDLLIADRNGQLWYDLRRPEDGERQRERFQEFENVWDLGLVREGDVAFDVGAHQGSFTVWLSKRVGPRGHVFAFEPALCHCDVLRANLELNGCENVTVVQAVVGADRGAASFDPAILGVVDGPDRDHGVLAEAVRLDDFAEAQPAFVKIDVEGYECEVLRGARRVLERKPALDIEIHGPILANRVGEDPAAVADLAQLDRHRCWLVDPSRGDAELHAWQPGEQLAAPDRNTWLYARPEPACASPTKPVAAVGS
jgi:FkbM family methyltransferase